MYMSFFRSIGLYWIALVLLLSQTGCFFSGGVSTFQKTTSARGSGFLSAIEHNGEWDANGPPPRVGQIAERQLYQKLEKTGTFAIGYLGNVYELSELYAPKRYRVAAIREVGTNTEGSATVHFYEVEFDPEGG